MEPTAAKRRPLITDLLTIYIFKGACDVTVTGEMKWIRGEYIRHERMMCVAVIIARM